MSNSGKNICEGNVHNNLKKTKKHLKKMQYHTALFIASSEDTRTCFLRGGFGNFSKFEKNHILLVRVKLGYIQNFTVLATLEVRVVIVIVTGGKQSQPSLPLDGLDWIE